MTSPVTRAHFMNGRSGRAPSVVHAPEDAAVHRLEAVAHVGQGAGDDDRHGVVEEGALHLLLDLDRLDQPVGGDRGIAAVDRRRRTSSVGMLVVSHVDPRWWVGSECGCVDSDVEEAHVLGVGLDEVLAGLDVVAHERGDRPRRRWRPARRRPAAGCGWPRPWWWPRARRQSISPRPFRRANSFLWLGFSARKAFLAASSLR